MAADAADDATANADLAAIVETLTAGSLFTLDSDDDVENDEADIDTGADPVAVRLPAVRVVVDVVDAVEQDSDSDREDHGEDHDDTMDAAPAATADEQAAATAMAAAVGFALGGISSLPLLTASLSAMPSSLVTSSSK